MPRHGRKLACAYAAPFNALRGNAMGIGSLVLFGNRLSVIMRQRRVIGCHSVVDESYVTWLDGGIRRALWVSDSHLRIAE
jgi:hypothetical protein